MESSGWKTVTMLDERQIRSLHVEALTREELAADGHEPHVLHQTSTIKALLDGAYDGDLTLGELREAGDLGLGTTNGLDGELIVLDRRCYRASIDGSIQPLANDVMTPFAVVAEFQPTIEIPLIGPMDFDRMTSELDTLRPSGMPSCAVRVDGSFGQVRARSVPRQNPPYRPLTEIIGDQRVFDLDEIEGTLVGFRFPDYAGGIEVGGWHLHFIDVARTVGGHVMDFELRNGTAKIDPSNELHAEMPPGIGLGSNESDQGVSEQISKVERDPEGNR
jgi:acetolactate decarboxylase